MVGKGYREVRVTIDLKNKTVDCDPDPAQCYWKTGPDCIRWVFPKAPKKVKRVVIEWQNPGPPFKGGRMFDGLGAEASTVGSHLPDLITFKNTQVQGKFKYSVVCLDGEDVVVAEKDPTGANDEQPPN